MKKSTQHAASDRPDAPQSAQPQSQDPALAGAARKPYRRPVVEKRRSVKEATLFSAGGTGGSLVGGSP